MIPRTNAGDVQIWTLQHDGAVHVAPISSADLDDDRVHGGRAHVGQVRQQLHAALVRVPDARCGYLLGSVSFVVEHAYPPVITWRRSGETVTGEAFDLACTVMAEAIADARRMAS